MNENHWSKGTWVRVRGYDLILEVVKPHPRKPGFVRLKDGLGREYDALATSLRKVERS